MQLIEETAEEITVLEPHGRIDSATAPEFGERLNRLLEAGRTAILVNLQNVAFVSSAGFHALLLANRTAVERHSRLVLCGLLDEVRRLFEIGGFIEQFLICQSRDEGLERLKQLPR
jgi:anti-sigma B factor antagonist